MGEELVKDGSEEDGCRVTTGAYVRGGPNKEGSIAMGISQELQLELEDEEEMGTCSGGTLSSFA